MAEKFEVIIGATDKATPILQKFENRLKTTQTTSQKLTTGLSRLGDQAKWAYLGLSGAIAGSVKVFADFETAMAKVATQLPGELMSHFDEMKASVSSLAIEFGQSANTMAQGLYDILSAAIEPEHALDLLAVTAKTAAAGFTDVATTTDLFTSILNAYGMEVSEAANVSDTLFQSVFRGKMEFEDLAKELGPIMGIAAQAGVGLEDLGAAMATLTRQGIPTSEAATGIRQAILSFISPTEGAATAAKNLGFELDANALKSKGLINAILELEGATTEEVAALFGNVRALMAVQGVLSDASGATEDLRLNYEALGTTQEAYDKATNTLAFTLKQLKEAGMEVVRTLGESFAPTIKEWAERLTEFAKGFASISDESKNFLSKTLLVVAGVLGFISALGLAVKAINNLFTALGLAGAVSAPLTLALLAIGLAIAAIWIFFPEIVEFFEKLKKTISESAQPLEEYTKAFDKFYEANKKGMQEMGVPEPLAGGLVNQVSMIQALTQTVIDSYEKVKNYLETHKIGDIWGDVTAGYNNLVQTLGQTSLGQKLGNNLINQTQKIIIAWENMKKTLHLDDAAKWIADEWEDFKKGMSVEAFTKDVTSFWEDLKKVLHLKEAVDWIKTEWEDFRAVFNFDNFKTYVSVSWNEILETYQS